jgi:hypothetical protein
MTNERTPGVAAGARWRAWQVMPFDCLLLRPRETAAVMARHLGRELVIDRMVDVVRPRSPRCLPGFLEHTLVAA